MNLPGRLQAGEGVAPSNVFVTVSSVAALSLASLMCKDDDVNVIWWDRTSQVLPGCLSLRWQAGVIRLHSWLTEATTL